MHVEIKKCPKNLRRWAAVICMVVACQFLFTGCQVIDYFKDPVGDGLEQLEKKEYAEAIASFEEAIEKEKEPSEAYRGIGIAYWEQEKYAEAKTAFQQALQNGAPETGTIYNFLGICSLKEGSLDQALSYFENGIQCEEEGSSLRQEMEFNVISICEQKLDWENAKLKMEEYIAKYPDDEKAVKEAAFLKTR